MKYTTPLQIHAYDVLKQMILEDRFLPDKIHSERRISEELGISRTPLRDAIHRLAQEGYIDVIPSKGFQLHKMTAEDLVNTYEIRCALEGFCVVHLAKTSDLPETKKVLHTLEGIVQEQENIASSTYDIESFASLDTEFHKRIVNSKKNPIFTDTFETYRYQMNMQTIASLQEENRLHDTVKEHRAILENMKSGNEWGSYNATIQHIGMAQRLININRD